MSAAAAAAATTEERIKLDTTGWSFTKFLSNGEPGVYVLSSESCPFSQGMEPELKQIVDRYPNVDFVRLERRKSGNLLWQYSLVNRVEGYPMFVGYNKRAILFNVIGADMEELETRVKALSQLLAEAAAPAPAPAPAPTEAPAEAPTEAPAEAPTAAAASAAPSPAQ